MLRPTLALLAFATLVGCAHAAPPAARGTAPGDVAALAKGGCTLTTGVPMYRVFRGVRRADVTPAAFMQALGDKFIPMAPQTHGGKGLMAYVPAVPPAGAPEGTPDEIAIVIYQSEAVYQERRNSPEGKAYGDAHWDLFQRAPVTKSDTAVGLKANGPALKPEVPVDMMENANDWQCGHATVYIGRRKAAVPAADFLPKLSQHVANAKQALAPKGLRGYIVVANQDQEIAWLSWASKAAADRAFASPAGKAVAEEGAALMDHVMWTAAGDFAGAIKPGEAVNVKFPR